MKYKTQEDILTYTAREAKISEEQLKVVLKDFWSTIRLLLTNPLTTKQGILLNEFGKFYIKPYTVTKKKERLEKRTPGSIKIKEHEQLLNQLKTDESKNTIDSIR